MKCYRFSVDKWSCCPCGANENRAILRDWCIENDYKKTPLYVADDVYVYCRDKSELHMVIENHDWDSLPSVLENRGADIFDYLMNCVENRNASDIEDDFYNYLIG